MAALQQRSADALRASCCLSGAALLGQCPKHRPPCTTLRWQLNFGDDLGWGWGGKAGEISLRHGVPEDA